MANTYSVEQKKAAIERVRSHLRAGGSRAEAFRIAAEETGISVSTLRRWGRANPLPDDRYLDEAAAPAPAQDNPADLAHDGRQVAVEFAPVAPDNVISTASNKGRVAQRVLRSSATAGLTDKQQSWWTRNRDIIAGQVIAGLVAGLIVSGFGAVLAAQFSADLARSQSSAQDQAEAVAQILENTRFVREVVINDTATRPLMDLDLRGASLGLNFMCVTPRNYESGLLVCLDFSRSDLSGAKMFGANLTDGMLADTKFVDSLMFNVLTECSHTARIFRVRC
jgi:hypothetical protein